MTAIDGNTLEGVSATTLWTLHNRGSEAKRSDGVIRDYLGTHPGASVVALAEGLQSSFWRLERTGVIDGSTWYSVDLPPVMDLRRLLPRDDRILELAQSALDRIGPFRRMRPSRTLLEFG